MGKRFLISRLSSLGDVVCSLPAAGALKQKWPDSTVVWAVDSRFAGIVRSCRHVDEVAEVKPSFHRKSWPKWDGEFEAAMDLQGLLKSALAIKNAKASAKVGYHWQREGAWLFSTRIIPDPTSVHVVDQYVDVARAVGGEGETADFGLCPTDAAIETIAELSLDEPFVVMNGGAGWVTKRWSPGNFGQLVDMLGNQGLKTVLIGGPSEDDLVVQSQIEQSCHVEPISLAGKTSVAELVAVLARAKAHVGGDTGSSHLAAGLGIPAIGLYSITKPARSCPYRQIERCHYDARGLHFIEPEAVFKTIMGAIAA